MGEYIPEPPPESKVGLVGCARYSVCALHCEERFALKTEVVPRSKKTPSVPKNGTEGFKFKGDVKNADL